MKHATKFLIAGDGLAIIIVTAIGFASHKETDLALLPRMLATCIPLAFGWFLVARLLRLFDPEITHQPRQLWRPLMTMFLAGPLAALWRAFLLNTVVIPIFGVVLSGSAGLGMLVWRMLWLAWIRKMRW